MAAVRAFGGQLFEAVFADSRRDVLRASLNEALRRGVNLRLRLRLGDVPELSSLPWEYLYDGTTDRFFVLSEATPLVRYLEVPEPVAPLHLDGPLNILFMVASPPGYPPLDVDLEWTKIKESVAELESRGLVRLNRLASGSLAALRRELRREQYHIFHFVGHGAFDQGVQEGVLLLENEGGQGRPATGRDLGWCCVITVRCAWRCSTPVRVPGHRWPTPSPASPRAWCCGASRP